MRKCAVIVEGERGEGLSPKLVCETIGVALEAATRLVQWKNWYPWNNFKYQSNFTWVSDHVDIIKVIELPFMEDPNE